MCMPRDDMKSGHRHHGLRQSHRDGNETNNRPKRMMPSTSVNRASKIDLRAALYALQPHAYPWNICKSTFLPMRTNSVAADYRWKFSSTCRQRGTALQADLIMMSLSIFNGYSVNLYRNSLIESGKEVMSISRFVFYPAPITPPQSHSSESPVSGSVIFFRNNDQTDLFQLQTQIAWPKGSLPLFTLSCGVEIIFKKSDP